MAKVYVGTYKKYNEGNLKGAWLDLADYESYSEFVAACKKLHNDEKSPELMIQDLSDFPDGLECGEWMQEDEFNDIKKATNRVIPKIEIINYSEKCLAVVGDTKPLKGEFKKLGGKFNPKLTCGAGWVFSKDKIDGLFEIQTEGEVSESTMQLLGVNKTTGARETTTGEQSATDGAEYAQSLNEWAQDDYDRKNNVGAVKINGYYFPISKPSIENTFCFHDEGPNYEEYLDVTKTEDNLVKYFLIENLDKFDRHLNSLKEGEKYYVRNGNEYDKQRLFVRAKLCVWGTPETGEHEMTEDEREAIIKGLQWGRAQFEKRLKVYLKRYGTSKLKTRTYWADA